MGTKKRITKENYQEVALGRSIIACWVILFVCVVIKFLGGNFFEIVCNSNGFITVSNFIQNTVLFDIIQLISFMFSSYLIVKCIDFGINKKDLITFLSICLMYWVFKELIKFNIVKINTFLHNSLEFIVLYIASIMCCNKKKKSLIRLARPLLFIVLMLIFTLISVIVKNIGIGSSLNESFLIGFIFMIDYYIMLILTFLYQKRRYQRWVLGDGSLG